MIRRREFITLLGGAATAWPLAARAQQAERMRRIGVLMSTGAQTIRMGRPVSPHSCKACRNWAGPRAATCGSISAGRRRSRTHSQRRRGIGGARAGSHPGHRRPAIAPLQQVTRTVPIVFVIVPDPVGAGFVDSLARPGGNATGFTIVRVRFGREMAGTAQADRAAA